MQVAKIDQTTVIVLAAIFGTLGGLVGIALLLYIYRLIKRWIKDKFKSDTV